MKLYTDDAIKEQVHKLLCQDCEETDVCPICDYRELIDEILDATTVDAVPVVRCKDCKWYEIAHLKRDGTADKRHKPSMCMIGAYAKPRKADWYCADGERREDGLDSDSTLGNP